MRLSTAKDITLRSLVNRFADKRYGLLKVYDKQAALFDLDKEGFIKIIEVSAIGGGKVRAYAFQALLPKGVHFVNSNQSFRRKAFWEWVAELPKKYWFIPIFAGSLIANAKDFATWDFTA